MPKLKDLKIGDKASLTKTFTQEDINTFAEISLDKNPIHIDEQYAQKTQFKKTIVHGILQAGLISAVLGNKLPGPGAIYREQTLTFKKPAFAGDTLTAEVEVIEIIEKLKIVVCKTTIKNQSGQILTVGRAKGIMPE